MNLEQQLALIRSGQMYNDLTPELVDARRSVVLLTNRYNTAFSDLAVDREKILRELLGGIGVGVHFEPNFRCEFGKNIFIGDNFYANFDCVMLDGGGIDIGNDVLFGPRVGIYTTNHATDPAERAAGACYAKPVRIGDRVWIGGGCTSTLASPLVVAASSVLEAS